MNYLPLICTLVGAAGVLFSIIIAVIVKGSPAGNEKMQNIANAIKEGAIAYLNRQLKSMGIAGLIIFVIIIFTLGVKTAIGFLLGANRLFSGGIHRHARVGYRQRAHRRSCQRGPFKGPVHGF